METNYLDPLLELELHLQSSSNNAKKVEKQRKSISITKQKIFSTDILVSKYLSKDKILNEAQRDLLISKNECKNIYIDYTNSLEKCTKLEDDLQKYKNAKMELEKQYLELENQFAAFRSHTNQLQVLVKEQETVIEASKIETRLDKSKVKEFDKKFISLQKEVDLLNSHILTFCDIVFGGKILSDEFRKAIRKYNKYKNTDVCNLFINRRKKSKEITSLEHSADEGETFDDCSLSPYSNNPRENNKAAIVARNDLNKDSEFIDTDSDSSNEIVSVDTGRGSSLVFSDSEKCFNSPEYFNNDSPLGAVITNNKEKRNRVTTDVATSPISFYNVVHTASSPIEFMSTVERATSPFKMSSGFTVDSTTSPLTVISTENKAVSPIIFESCKQYEQIKVQENYTVESTIDLTLNGVESELATQRDDKINYSSDNGMTCLKLNSRKLSNKDVIDCMQSPIEFMSTVERATSPFKMSSGFTVDSTTSPLTVISTENKAVSPIIFESCKQYEQINVQENYTVESTIDLSLNGVESELATQRDDKINYSSDNGMTCLELNSSKLSNQDVMDCMKSPIEFMSTVERVTSPFKMSSGFTVDSTTSPLTVISTENNPESQTIFESCRQYEQINVQENYTVESTIDLKLNGVESELATQKDDKINFSSDKGMPFLELNSLKLSNKDVIEYMQHEQISIQESSTVKSSINVEVNKVENVLVCKNKGNEETKENSSRDTEDCLELNSNNLSEINCSLSGEINIQENDTVQSGINKSLNELESDLAYKNKRNKGLNCSLNEKNCLALNSSTPSERDITDIEVEMILDTMKFNYKLISPLPPTPMARNNASRCNLNSLSEENNTLKDMAVLKEENKKLNATLASHEQEIKNIKSLINKLMSKGNVENNIEGSVNIETNNNNTICDIIHKHDSTTQLVEQINDRSVEVKSPLLLKQKHIELFVDTPEKCNIKDNVVNGDVRDMSLCSFESSHSCEDNSFDDRIICSDSNDKVPRDIFNDVEDDTKHLNDTSEMIIQERMNKKMPRNKKLNKIEKLKKKFMPKSKIKEEPSPRNTRGNIQKLVPQIISSCKSKIVTDMDTSATLNNKDVYERALQVMRETKTNQNNKGDLKGNKGDIKENKGDLKDNNELENIDITKTALITNDSDCSKLLSTSPKDVVITRNPGNQNNDESNKDTILSNKVIRIVIEPCTINPIIDNSHFNNRKRRKRTPVDISETPVKRMLRSSVHRDTVTDQSCGNKDVCTSGVRKATMNNNSIDDEKIANLFKSSPSKQSSRSTRSVRTRSMSKNSDNLDVDIQQSVSCSASNDMNLKIEHNMDNSANGKHIKPFSIDTSVTIPNKRTLRNSTEKSFNDIEATKQFAGNVDSKGDIQQSVSCSASNDIALKIKHNMDNSANGKNIKPFSVDKSDTRQNKRTLRNSTETSFNDIEGTKQFAGNVNNKGDKKIISYSDLEVFSEKQKSFTKSQDLQKLSNTPSNSILCNMIDKYAKHSMKTFSKKIPDSVTNSIYKTIEDDLEIIAQMPSDKVKEGMNKLVEKLQKCQPKLFLSGLMSYLKNPARKIELFNKIQSPLTPSMTKSEQILLYILMQLKMNPPYCDIVEKIWIHIEYTLFRLNTTPEFGIIESMSHFYAILCRYFRARSRLRLFILDAMYCMNFKAVPLIRQCFDVWAHVLPLAHMGIAKNPLITCLVYLLHFFKCKDDRYHRVQDIRNILANRYHFQMADWNETKILEIFKNAIEDIRENPLEKKMLRMAFIILAKRHKSNWCHNIIIKNLLLPIINSDKSPNRIKQFCVRLLGPLMKPYPETMKVHCEVVINLLLHIMNQNPSQQMQEAVIESLTFMSKHNENKILKTLITWHPHSISIELEELLRDYVQQKPVKIWRSVLSKLSFLLSKDFAS